MTASLTKSAESAAITPGIKWETLDELIHDLGDIPPSRILLQPAPGTATEADVIRWENAPRKRLCELIDGVLVEKGMGYSESRLAVRLSRLLDEFCELHNLGSVSGGDGGFWLSDTQMRMPDVAFIARERLPIDPEEAYPAIAPDLVVEIISRSNTPREMARKRAIYFAAGVRLVWEIDHRTRTARVFTAAETSVTLGENDTLDGGDVLPGFQVALPALWALVS